MLHRLLAYFSSLRNDLDNATLWLVLRVVSP
jgi:hypothetical protein